MTIRLRLYALVLVLAVSAAPSGGSPRAELDGTTGPTARSTPAAEPDWHAARGRVRAWLDTLEIDAAELTRHGVKGKKKLAEILEAYLLFHDHTTDPAERKAILRRVEGLIEQTRDPAYHNMKDCTPRELSAGSMAYLHVAALIDAFGIDTSDYLTQVRRAKARLDRHLAETRPASPHRLKWGTWSLVRFGQLYDRCGLDKPALLRAATLDQGVIRSRFPVERYTPAKVYELTHELLIAFDWGRSRTQSLFDREDLEFARDTLAALIPKAVGVGDPDMVGSLVTDMAYLGLESHPACREGLEYLLAAQNENGSWGDYETHRPRWGRHLEAHAYLHTTLVTLRGMFAAFEGDFPPALGPATRREAPPGS